VTICAAVSRISWLRSSGAKRVRRGLARVVTKAPYSKTSSYFLITQSV
jgi:hypothetical protein